MMRLQNVRKTHQLEYDAEPAERSAGGASRGGRPLIDLTVSNPTECGFEYDRLQSWMR